MILYYSKYMSLVFINNLVSSNMNLQYHLVTILYFPLYHLLAKIYVISDQEDERFQDYGSTLIIRSNSLHWLW